VQTVFASGISPSAVEILDEAQHRRSIYRPAMNLPRVEAMLLFEVDGAAAGRARWDRRTHSLEVVSPLARGSNGRTTRASPRCGKRARGRRGGRHAAARLAARVLR
jgi:hypothetical protein